jgi:hypothetical protein
MCLFGVRLASTANLIMQLDCLGRNEVLGIEGQFLTCNRIFLHGILLGLHVSGRFRGNLRLLLEPVWLRAYLRLLDHESIVAWTIGG